MHHWLHKIHKYDHNIEFEYLLQIYLEVWILSSVIKTLLANAENLLMLAGKLAQ